jgi:SAM-dependent methyltransferase
MFKLTRHYNWLIFRLLVPEIEGAIRKYGSGRMLDIGCGEKPYETIAGPFVDEHVGVDHEGTFHDKSAIDLIGTAYDIPAEDGSFDTVLCTNVLEHLEEPGRAVAEAYRALRPGGHAIYTVPLYWHLHEEPRDFYRFTKYGLRYLFEKNRFEVVEIKAISGFCATFAQELAYFLERFRKGGPLNPLWWLVPPAGLLVQGLGYLLNKVDRSERFTVEYIAVAKKPGMPATS